MKFQCYFCNNVIASEADFHQSLIGRQDDCEKCSRPLHSCMNCGFYDKSSYNECHEPQADRVVDKEKSNFCDYFKPRLISSIKEESHKPVLTPQEKARAAAEALFSKKKP